MIWFYSKGGDHVRCEIRQPKSDQFELVITEPDGRERVELFPDSTLLHKRSKQLEQEWKAQGWDGPFSRDF